MEEIRKSVCNIERKRVLGKNKFQRVLFFVLSMTVLFIMYEMMTSHIKQRLEIIEDDFSWVFQVDDITKNEELLVITGWAFELDRDANFLFEVVFYDMETGKGYFPKIKYEARTDVNDYFLCEFDYTKSGFEATIPLDELDLENKVYEVLIRPQSITAISTGIYYKDEDIFYVHPEQFVPLQTKGTDLEEITEKGVLRVYEPEIGMYVYQYGGELYWIAEEHYGFVNGNTYVQLLLYTTQFDKLPEERKTGNNPCFTNGFHFKKNELQDLNTGQYRVTKCALPTEYSIRKIGTGNYKDEWIWRSVFRPWYEFD